MSVVCSCPRDALCSTCVRQELEWLGGTADCRGDRWARSVAERRPELLAQPWPELSGRALEIALGKLADLTSDVHVAEQLLVQLQKGATRAWARMQQERR